MSSKRVYITKAKNVFYKNYEWLHEQYEVQEKTLREIADIVDCDPTTISNWLKEFDIKARPSSQHNLGNVPWNKGLTKGTDPRMQQLSIHRQRGRRDKDKLYAKKEWLHEMYIDRCLSQTQIAENQGCTYQDIGYWLRYHGFTVRTSSEAIILKNELFSTEPWRNKEILTKEYVGKQKTMVQLSKEFECDTATIANWLKKFNIEIRTRNDQKGENNYYWKGGMEGRRQRAIANGWKPYTENKNCSMYLGVHIAERVLSRYFDDVVRMPLENPGYDYICKRGRKIDVKSSTLHNNNAWSFGIDLNKIPDYFLCIAFDDIEHLNPIKLWLIPGPVINYKKSISMTNSERVFKKWSQYEKPIDKVEACCEKLQEKNIETT